MRHAVVFCAALCLALVSMAPASLFDAALDRATAGHLRLADAEGSIWAGRGRLANAPDGGQGTTQAWAVLGWRWQPGALLDGALGWRLTLEGRSAAVLAIHAGGWRLEDARLELPAGPLLAAIPHAAARAGWHGRLRATGPGLHCDWKMRCQGELALEWQAARVDVFPGRVLGDYRLQLAARSNVLEAALESPTGNRLRLDGTLALAAGRPRISLRIQGEDGLVGRLPAILHGLARPDAGGGLRIDWPQR